MGLGMTGQQPGRNDPCPCGSKLKFKHCHGDESKRVIANRVANLKMMGLVRVEQKKRGIVPWDWKCKDCGHGFDKVLEGTITNMAGQISPLCPKCNSANITQNSNGGEDEDHGAEEENTEKIS